MMMMEWWEALPRVCSESLREEHRPEVYGAFQYAVHITHAEKGQGGPILWFNRSGPVGLLGWQLTKSQDFKASGLCKALKGQVLHGENRHLDIKLLISFVSRRME